MGNGSGKDAERAVRVLHPGVVSRMGSESSQVLGVGYEGGSVSGTRQNGTGAQAVTSDRDSDGSQGAERVPQQPESRRPVHLQGQEAPLRRRRAGGQLGAL